MILVLKVFACRDAFEGATSLYAAPDAETAAAIHMHERESSIKLEEIIVGEICEAVAWWPPRKIAEL